VTGIEDLLGLPEKARVRQRLTKKEIVAQYEATSPVDARLLTKSIASATIVGVLRPETIGVRTFQDAHRRVDFVPVLDIVLAERSRPADRPRVAELLHRSMPRPAILAFQEPDGEELLSVALTRLSKTDSGQETSVIEASLLVPPDGIAPGALNIHRLNQADLWALYRDVVRVAATDGHPASAALTATEAIALRQRLAGLESELGAVVRDARREKNQQRRIDLNTQGRRLRTQIERVHGSLFAPVLDTVTSSPASLLTHQGRNQ
jgi:hypothetical protein